MHATAPHHDRISIQLYTLRDQLTADLDQSLAELRAIGYTNVEHAGFVGRSATEFRAALDTAGLRATSGHVAIPQPFDESTWEAALHDANIVGNIYVVHPQFGRDPATGDPIRDADRYRALAGDLNRAATIARRNGLRLGYHNHQNEFLPQTGGPPAGTRHTGYDILTAETDPDLVHFELDVYWAWRGAADPVDLIRANPGRFSQLHVKDLDVSAAFADPGDGLVDFPRIFAEAARDVEYIVERDDAGTPPRRPGDALRTARAGYDYLSRCLG